MGMRESPRGRQRASDSAGGKCERGIPMGSRGARVKTECVKTWSRADETRRGNSGRERR